MTKALRLSATDIHIIPRKHKFLVQFRLEHRLIPQLSLTFEESERLISHLKFLASMDIGEKRRPQNGSITMHVADQIVGLRLSTLPTMYYESLVIRLIPEQKIVPLKQLSLFPHSVRKLSSLLKFSHGMLILTGPTGSGKTTTLYSLLQYSPEINNRNIITLEDPIENESERILQVQINEKAGISYSNGLKAVLRHDPDIIMVGEIRDKETAKIAIRAALTGHLILTTMHTRDAAGAIHRLMEFGVSWNEIQQSLIGVSAQRLVEVKREAERRRASVYELLYGRNLNLVLQDIKGAGVIVSYRTLKQELAKAVALGFIEQNEFERLVMLDA